MRSVAFIALALFALYAGVVPHDAGAATLYGLVDTGELFASSDDGITWSVLAALPISDAVGIAAAGTSDELFLVTRSGIVYRSTDAGVNWAAVGSVAASDVTDMLIRPGGGVFLLSRAGILWRSADEGVTFASLATLAASNLVSMTADNTDNLYILARTGEVARSSDEGESWSMVGVVTTSEAVEIRAAGADLFVLTGSGDVARSTDQGVTWMMVGTMSQVHMSSLTLNGTDLVATSTEGLIASSPDGTAWTWVGSINQLTVQALGNDTPTSTGIGPNGPPAITALRMDPPWPNPTSGYGKSISFSFILPGPDAVAIELYAVDGRLVARRAPQTFSTSGQHVIRWDARRFGSGVYFARLVTGTGLHAQRKLVVVR